MTVSVLVCGNRCWCFLFVVVLLACLLLSLLKRFYNGKAHRCGKVPCVSAFVTNNWFQLGLAFQEAQRSQQLSLRLRAAVPEEPKHKRTRRRRRPKKKAVVAKTHDRPMTRKDLYFALRCGLVTTRQGMAVGRVTIVNYDHEVVVDDFVQVPVPVVDYRGLDAERMAQGVTFDQVRRTVAATIAGKIVIGHGLEIDLQQLGLSHPWSDVRDTANYAPFMKEVADALTIMLLPRDLPDLAKDLLDRTSIEGPIAEAVTMLDLYKYAREDWEAELIAVMQQKERQRQLVAGMRQQPRLGAISEHEVYQKRERSKFYETPTPTLASATVTPFTSTSDDVSESSSFFSGEAGFNTGVYMASEIENLREVLDRQVGDAAADQPYWTPDTTSHHGSSGAASVNPSWYAEGSETWSYADWGAEEQDDEELRGHLPSTLLADIDATASQEPPQVEEKRSSWFRRRLSGYSTQR